MAIDLSDYVPVAERIAKLRADHPTAVLRTIERYFVEIAGQWGWVVTAECYLSPDDPLPSTGSAWEPFPGTTPYTRGSELQNAETSAWGRAIVAHLAADTTKGIASADEVRLRAEDGGGERKASDSQIRTLEREIELRGLPDGEPWPDYPKLTMRGASELIDRVKARPLETPPPVRAASTRASEQAGAAASSPEDSALPPEAGPPGDDARPWNRRAYPFIAGSDVRARYWKMVAAALPGIGDTRLLNVARDIATERGLPVPAEMGDVTEPELVDALRKWADARADEKGVAI